MHLVYQVLNLLNLVILQPLIILSLLLFAVLSWLAAPFFYVGHFLLQAALLPVKVLAKFEVSKLPFESLTL